MTDPGGGRRLTLAKEALERIHLRRPLGLVHRRLRAASRAALGVDRRITKRYLAEAVEPKLHIGCGRHLLAGWLNSDLHRYSGNVLRLDAARPFPFPDDAFAYVYSEHMIEHICPESAKAMLSECFRVLVPGGKVRVSTPDLAFLVALFGPERPPRLERYIEWYHTWADLPGKEIAFVIDHFLRAWGHRFVYDEPALRGALETAGFSHVTRRGLNDSGDAALRGLANEGRMPEGFLDLESMTLEGTK